MIMTNTEFEKLELKESEAEENLEKAFVAWVNTANDCRLASLSVFDGMSYMELVSRIMYMIKDKTSGIYDSEIANRFHIVELRPDGTFVPIDKQITLKFAFE
jgi:hypothetical protein